RNGPWLAENGDPGRTLTLEDIGANLVRVTCTGSAWTHFKPQHVGALLLIRPPGGYPGLRTWAPNVVKAAGEAVISVGRAYQTIAGGTTGNTPPNHESGTVSDGGVEWTFVHDGATVFAIDSFVSATEVITIPLGTPPMNLTTGPVATANWSDQAFSGVEGWPTALAAVREERLVLAGTPQRPDVVEFTRTAGFDVEYADWKPGLGTGLVVDDDGCRVRLGEERARVVWMVNTINLIVGTTEAEWIIAGATLDDAITPAGAKERRVSAYGSDDVMPVVVQGPPPSLLFVARGGTTYRELTLGPVGDGDSNGRDLSILAQHIFGVGVKDHAWVRPDNQAWLLLKDNTLACLTYHREHGVLGARRQPLPEGWFAESLCAVPDVNGQDQLHVAAVRLKAGSPQRAHLQLARRTEGLFLDIAELYQGAATTTIGGLGHFEGEVVFALADGAEVRDLTVASGQITLPHAASKVLVGRPLRRFFKSLPFDPERDGRPIAKDSRPVAAYLSMKCVHAVVRAEPQDEPDDRYIPQDEVIQRRPEDAVPVLRRKRAKVTLGAGADKDVRVIVETDAPYDLQLFGLRCVYETPR
ncbi:MAG: hypothetical protein DI570_18935, partial [Phenylobacterium zucineum]